MRRFGGQGGQTMSLEIVEVGTRDTIFLVGAFAPLKFL
jgi:hypothetical protein